MGIARTSALSAAATVARLAAALVLNKLLAVYTGPAGFAVVGQFQSLMAIVSAAAGGVFGAGVTKLTAEHHTTPQRQHAAWQTALSISLGLGALASLILLFLRDPLAISLLGDGNLTPALVCLAASTGLLALNMVLLGALSGLKAVERYVGTSLLGSLFSVLFAVWLVPSYGLQGALLALVLTQALSGALALLLFQGPGLRRRDLLGKPDGASARALGGLAMMAATTALAVPLSQIGVRAELEEVGGSELAGLWHAMWRLSDTHLLLLTSAFSLYLLPRLAQIRDGDELLREIRRVYGFVLAVVACTSISIVLLREQLVEGLFSTAFAPVAAALPLQLLGDVLKIASWVPAYTMVSHARVRLFIASEIAFVLLLSLLIVAGAHWHGLLGSAAGYALAYALYWLVMHWQCNVLARRLQTSSTSGSPT